MAVTKIDDVHLYAGMTDGIIEANNMKKWLKDNNIEYTLMFYADESAHTGLLEALSSWWRDDSNAAFTDFPILVYTEIHDDLPPSRYPRKFFKTLSDMQNSNFLSVYKVTDSGHNNKNTGT
jgi:hypothetical protein